MVAKPTERPAAFPMKHWALRSCDRSAGASLLQIFTVTFTFVSYTTKLLGCRVEALITPSRIISS